MSYIRGSGNVNSSSNNTFTGDNTFQGDNDFDGNNTYNGTNIYNGDTIITGDFDIDSTNTIELETSSTLFIQHNGTSGSLGLGNLGSNVDINTQVNMLGGNLDMFNHFISNIPNPLNVGDAVNLGFYNKTNKISPAPISQPPYIEDLVYWIDFDDINTYNSFGITGGNNTCGAIMSKGSIKIPMESVRAVTEQPQSLLDTFGANVRRFARFLGAGFGNNNNGLQANLDMSTFGINSHLTQDQIFIVFRPLLSNAQQGILSADSGFGKWLGFDIRDGVNAGLGQPIFSPAGTYALSLFGNDSNNIGNGVYRLSPDANNAITNASLSGLTKCLNVNHYFSMTGGAGTMAGAFRVDAYLNGVSVSPPSSVRMDGLNGATTLRLGCTGVADLPSPAVQSEQYAGDIMEVLIYSAPKMSIGQRQEVEAYLSTKWNLGF